MKKRDDMETLKIIIGQGNGTAGIQTASIIIDNNFPKHKHLFLISCSSTEVIETAKDFPNCIVLLGNVWGGQTSGTDIALKIREVNNVAKIYQYSLMPSSDPGKIFDGIIQKGGDNELVSFLKKILN